MRGTSCKRRHAADEESHAADCWNREAGDGLPEKVGTDGREKKGEEKNKAGGGLRSFWNWFPKETQPAQSKNKLF